MPLKGLNEYLEEYYGFSVFDEALESEETYRFHVHGDRVVGGKVVENSRYEIKIEPEENGETEDILKHEIKLVYPGRIADKVLPLIKTDKKLKKKGLGPILQVSARGHIKNKTLYPLMKEREVLFFTMLEGEKLKGLVGGFSRYEIVLHMKGGLPITILRHGVYDVRNKKGRCFLKSTQENTRDWKKSALYMEQPA